MIRIVQSAVVPLLVDHIDTDQIIPARFLKTVNQEGLGQQLFADWRKDPTFVLNERKYARRSILLTGSNFGCGSSREHAAWALRAAGFSAVVAASFADIFRANALRNGLLPVEPKDYPRFLSLLNSDLEQEVQIDLQDQVIRVGDQGFGFEIDPFSKECLLRGLDPMSYLLEHLPQIESYEASHA